MQRELSVQSQRRTQPVLLEEPRGPPRVTGAGTAREEALEGASDHTEP